MPRANIQHTERAEQVTTETINFNFPKTENKSLHNSLKKGFWEDVIIGVQPEIPAAILSGIPIFQLFIGDHKNYNTGDPLLHCRPRDPPRRLQKLLWGPSYHNGDPKTPHFIPETIIWGLR